MILNPKFVKSFLFVMLIIWCAGIFFPVIPVMRKSYLVSYFFLDNTFSLVCHQQNAKSFFILGNKLEVCARCTGIYFGALINSVSGLIFSEIKLNSKKILLTAMVVMLLDVFFSSIGIYNYSKLIALFTGLILGSVSILYIFDEIDEYFFEVKNKPNVQ